MRPTSVCLLIAASACTGTAPSRAAAPAPARAPAAAAAITVAVPRQVAGFGLMLRHDYDDPRAGVQLRYSGPDSVVADVFVYPGPDLARDCARACAAQVLSEEIAAFRASFPELLRRGYVQAIAVAADESLVPPEGAPWQLGHHLRLAVTRAERPQRSEFYLFYVPGYRVKVRSTFDDTSPHLQSVDAFVAGIVPALVRGGSHAPPT